ncbi:MAG TPA: N-acetylmuramoyl-L-alanine amidase [Xanthobacteraceae bacterium]|nr:N-acetylmuramoyl-L-alanine amidase [Xanthobacteraceae bacterium]
MIDFRRALLALSIVPIALLAAGRQPALSQQNRPAYGAIRPAPAPPPAANPAPTAKPMPAAKLATTPTAVPTAKPAAASCHPETFRVVVDVGHTLDVPGAMSARGVPEYAFNVALAQVVKQALVDAGFTRTVLLITDKAPPLGLITRAAQANSIPADLFLSIHHDSVPDNLLQTWQYEGQDNHYNDDYPGYALFISNDNGDRAGSLLFGSFLGKELQARGLQYTPHYTLALMGHRRRQLLDPVAGVYRYDELIVLRKTRMPALLLEAGSIVNRAEELELGTSDRRARTSGAIAAAVADFCAARARPVAAKANTLRANIVPQTLPAASRPH